MRKKKIVNPDEIQIQKTRKKNVVKPKGSLLDLERNDFKAGNKISKRTSRNSPFPEQPERSNSDSFPESSTSGNEYRALRHRYLLLEEESFVVGRNLREVEDEVQTLEDEKLALLDQLLVLEGLIDPSELQSQGKF
ncbi:hypothetical protein UlMin_028666 [Ulmus minor]